MPPERSESCNLVHVLWECDATLRYTWISHAVEKVLGHAPADLVGRPLAEFVPPEALTDWEQGVGAALERQRSFSAVEAVNLNRDGRRVYLCCSAEPLLVEGEFHGFRGVHAEVSDLRRVLGDLSQLRFLVERSPNFVGVADLNGNALYCNDTGLRMVGVEREQVAGSTINDYLLPEAVEQHMREIYPVLLKQGTWRGQHHFRHFVTGETIPINAHLFVIRDANGAPQATAIIGRDLRTEREQERIRLQLEEQLRQAQKMESLGRLAGGIAHDFNNLLTPVIGNVSLLLRSSVFDSDQREQLELSLQAGERMAALTKQVLAFSHKQVLKLEARALDELVGEVHALLVETVAPSRLALSLNADGVAVEVDPLQLTQVLVNLVANARDALLGPGTVRLRTGRLTVESADSGAEAGSEGVAAGAYGFLEVHDQGAGIAPELLERVFEPFFSTKERGRGTGLGLAMVHGVVQQHGGRVRVRSELGVGTTFTVLLPAVARPEAPAAVEAQQSPPADRPSAGRGERILLLEDDPGVRAFVGALLAAEHYEVEAVADLAQARAVVAAGYRPDLLLSDVVLPDGRGPTFYEELLQTLPELPAVFISGYPDQATEALGAAGRFYLPKPFDPLALLAKLSLALGE